MSKSQLIVDIVGFLEQKITKGEISGDEKESLEVAIDCIRDTFGIKSDTAPQDLANIYERGIQSINSESSNSATGNVSPTSESVSEVSAEEKALADDLKSKGNKLMAQKEFARAADSYTLAIEKNPGNPIYYSNRAAAYTHLGLHSKAVDDARKATELDPKYSKAWSRLGLALWAHGDIKGSLDAYETGLKAEGDSPSEAMQRDYNKAKARYEEEMAKSGAVNHKSTQDDPSADFNLGGSATGANPGSGGFDFSQLSNLMKNPQIQKMAQNLMSDPSALNDLMNSPIAQQMKEKFGGFK